MEPRSDEERALQADLLDALAWTADRERIARDLHDTVIQRLFAIGLTLEGIAPSLPPEHGERLARAVDEIDQTIRRIRASIFELEAQHHDRSALRRQIFDACGEVRAARGVEIAVSFEGPIDSAVDSATGARLLATLREALTQVADGARVRVDVDVEADAVVVVVAGREGEIVRRALALGDG